MAINNSEVSVETADINNSKVTNKEDRFYIGLTCLALVGLVTLLVLALV